MNFEPGFSLAQSVDGNPIVAIAGGKIFVRESRDWDLLAVADLASLSLDVEQVHFLGRWQQRSCFAVCFSTPTTEDLRRAGFALVSLRSQLGRICDEHFQLVGRALQIVHWHELHQFCGRCGSRTRVGRSDRARVCTSCEIRFYPRLSPCVIGIVVRGDQCLLARGPRHPEGYYSALAGFIEPGETAEQALAREVKEEVGVVISDLEYIGSQPWPFPGQLMLAFLARHAGGEINVDGEEITEADWFRVGQLPLVPPSTTISGRLIQEFIERVTSRN